jgi:AcrR family transcriptional regulator
MTQAQVPQRRSNKRGLATRQTMLDAAVRSLASGDPGAVSATRIAKESGATWGAVQYQFGDVDGFWAAVLHRTAERRDAAFSALSSVESDAPLRERVGAIIDTLYNGLASDDSRAIESLRAALPRDHHELERLYPRTAAELFSWGKSWQETCQNAFAGLGVDPQRVREVAALIPGAMRGLVSERQLG